MDFHFIKKISAGLGSKSKKAPAKKRFEEHRVYSSPSEQLSRTGVLVGYIMRGLLIYVGIFGFTEFICSAAGMCTEVYWAGCYISPGSAALICLPVAVAVMCATLGSRWAALSLAAFTGVSLAVGSAFGENPLSFFAGSALRVYNYALNTLASRGFYSMGMYMYEDGFDYSQAGYYTSDPKLYGGAFLVASAVGLILYFCAAKKLRLIPTVIFSAAVMIPIFTYNASVGTVGIAFTVTFLCSCLVLFVSDYRYGGARERREKRKKARRENASKRKLDREKRRAEKEALRKESEMLYTAALTADMGAKRSRLARRSVYKAERSARKKKLQLEKENKRRARQNKTAAVKAEKERLREQSKQMRRLKAAAASDQEAARQLSQLENEQNQRRKERLQKTDENRALKKSRARQRRAVCAAGGYLGIGAAAAAFLAVWIPMSVTHNSFPIIDFINNKAQISRAYITAVLTGNDVDLNNLQAYGISELAPRTLSFEPLKYKDEKIFNVYASGKSNVYLRSWTGSIYDAATDTWSSADYQSVIDYRNRFGSEFTPDSITTAFYKYIYPSSYSLDKDNDFKNFTKFGFNTEKIDVWRVRDSSRLMLVPAVMNSDVSLTEYGTYEPNKLSFSNYYDGVYSSRFFKYGTGYGTVSFVTAMNRNDVGKSLDDGVRYYNAAVEYIEQYDADHNAQTAVNGFESTMESGGISYIGTSLVERYIYDMSDEEREAFKSSANAERDYAAYVYDNYTAKTESQAVSDAAASILNAAKAEYGENPNTYSLIMSTLEYFKNGYTYTLTPDGSPYAGGSVLDSFLLDVKEGYCTHFATAAAAIMREFGIPCRYAEGYVASDFSTARGNVPGNYYSQVLDSSAHAWIEVYYDRMGWIQYEVTPCDYAQDMYDPDSATVITDGDNNPDNSGDHHSPVPDRTGTDTDISNPDGDSAGYDEHLSDVQLLAITVAVLLALAILYFGFKLFRRFFVKKAIAAAGERHRIAERARSAEAYNDDKTDKVWLARQMHDCLDSIFEAIGAPPNKGELPEEYGERLSQLYGGLSAVNPSDVIKAIQKAEFGHGMSYDEMCMCADYMEDVINAVYAGLSPIQKLKLRYIRRII